MDERRQQKAPESVRDWSKWLVGVNLAAGAGCVAVLQTGVGGVLRSFLLAAIVFFGLALLGGAALMAILPCLMERLPVQDGAGRPVSVYEGRLWPGGMRVRTLVLVQCSQFVLALIAPGVTAGSAAGQETCNDGPA